MLLEQRHQKVPRGETTTERELRFSFSLSLSSRRRRSKKKKGEKHEKCVCRLSLLRERVTFRALISSGGGKGGGRFVSDCLSEIFSSVFSTSLYLGFTTLISLRSTSLGKSLSASEKAALEMTTNEGEDDDDIDFEEEEELLRGDVDRLLEEIAFLEETSSSSSSLRNAELRIAFGNSGTEQVEHSAEDDDDEEEEEETKRE